jgi:hypothetical protein
MKPRELDRRVTDGIRVTLFWHPSTNRIVVEVHDESTGATFELAVAPSRALDAFRHPYAYAASQGVPYATPSRAPEAALLD